MDPNATLTELVKFAEAVQQAVGIRDDLDGFKEDIPRVADLIQALGEWLSKGGFLPSRWER